MALATEKVFCRVHQRLQAHSRVWLIGTDGGGQKHVGLASRHGGKEGGACVGSEGVAAGDGVAREQRMVTGQGKQSCRGFGEHHQSRSKWLVSDAGRAKWRAK